MNGEPKFVRDEATGQSRAVIKTDEELAAEAAAAVPEAEATKPAKTKKTKDE